MAPDPSANGHPIALSIPNGDGLRNLAPCDPARRANSQAARSAEYYADTAR